MGPPAIRTAKVMNGSLLNLGIASLKTRCSVDAGGWARRYSVTITGSWPVMAKNLRSPSGVTPSVRSFTSG